LKESKSDFGFLNPSSSTLRSTSSLVLGLYRTPLEVSSLSISFFAAIIEAMKPQTRETVGWLVHEYADYIIICWDRDADPPTFKDGDPKASGLVVLRSDILEMKRIASAKQGPESNSGTLKPLFGKTEQPNSE
jgi:hypothetical protein